MTAEISETSQFTTRTTSPAHNAPKGLAITAMVLGILSAATGIFGWVGIVLGAAAIVLAVLALKKAQPRGLSVTGIVTGALGVLGGAAVLIIAMLFMSAFGAGVEALETGDLTQLESMGVEFETE